MKSIKTTVAALLAFFLLQSTAAQAFEAKGLNVIVTSADRQIQMMAMVLSVMSMKKHQKRVNMVLCGAAGDLALEATRTDGFKPSGKSPTQLLNSLLKMGAKVEVCPLYLPSVNKSKADLKQGVSIAKPATVAGRLLDTDYQILSY